MAWIILEGLDRTGKSSVAEHYQKQGYHVHHMSAPDKKFLKPGYVGPSYFESIVDLYMQYDGVDVVFDRSPYGELIWPKVYGRDPQLEPDDFELLSEYEDKNDTIKILMHDTNKEEHWKRCVENNEPLSKGQFNAAIEFFKGLADRYGFIKKTLPEIMLDFKKEIKTVDELKRTISNEAEARPAVNSEPKNDDAQVRGNNVGRVGDLGSDRMSPESKLEFANAIKSVLSRPIIKKSGGVFDKLEEDLRSFLTDKLDTLFGNDHISTNLDEIDVQILKQYCAQVKKKMEEKK